MKTSNACPPSDAQFRRIYVWELPVRFFHWINAFCILILCLTGYAIGAPERVYHANEAYQMYWFGVVRFIHFICAYIFIFNLLFRIYWGFVGNRYCRLKNYLPLKASQFKEIYEVLVADIFQVRVHGPETDGHNMLASVTYIGLFLLSIVQIILGFALYAPMSTFWLPHLFDWVTPLFGSEFPIRFIHHGLLWLFVLFVIVHVYISLYHDYIEGRGIISSIIGGIKFTKEDPKV